MRTWLSIPLVGLSFVFAAELLISNEVAAGAHTMVELKREEAELLTDVAILAQEVELLNSPQVLSEAAEDLGLVISTNPGYILLDSGVVINGEVKVQEEYRGFRPAGVPNAAVEELGISAKSLLASNTEKMADSYGSGETEGGESSLVLTSNRIPASPTF
jgi:hypothetical protein